MKEKEFFSWGTHKKHAKNRWIMKHDSEVGEQALSSV